MKFKLPRLSSPTTVTHKETSFNETITTEITYCSEFDLYPTWLQWTIVFVVTGLLGVILLLDYLNVI